MIITAHKNYIKLSNIPITRHRSKFRIKRPKKGEIAEQIFCRSYPIEKLDYIEWQIGYETDNLHEETLVKNIILRKENGIRYGFVLVKLIIEGYKLGLFTRTKIEEVKNLLFSNIYSIENGNNVKLIKEIEISSNEMICQFGFNKFVLQFPYYVKNADKYSVEIKIGHRERAVGYQAMVYLCLPLIQCNSEINKPLIGRIAEENEKIFYIIDESNKDIVYDTILAFIFSSNKHLEDLKLIFYQLEKEYGIK